MCEELSLITLRPSEGAPLRFIRGQDTRHHSHLIAAHTLREGVGAQANDPAFARSEYTPQDGDWDHCVFKLDEERKPSWFTAEIEAATIAEYQKWIKEITVDSDRPALLGGKWLVRGQVKIGAVDMCTILTAKDTQLTITSDIAGTVVFGAIYGTLTTGYVCGTLTTGNVSGTLATGVVYGTGSVKTGDVYGTGSVKTGDVAGTLITGYVDGTLTTGDVYGTGSVKTGDVYGTLITGYVSGTGSVKTGDVSGTGSVKSVKV